MMYFEKLVKYVRYEITSFLTDAERTLGVYISVNPQLASDIKSIAELGRVLINNRISLWLLRNRKRKISAKTKGRTFMSV